MTKSLQKSIERICSEYDHDRARLMDIVRSIHSEIGFMDDESIDLAAQLIGAPRIEVESLVTFYSFFSKHQRGNVIVRLCNDVIDRMNGADHVAKAFKQELGVDFGETTPDGKITLENTPCIGMSDQAPAALVNDEVITNLSSDSVRDVVAILRKTGDPRKLVHRLGDGNNGQHLVHSMVQNNVRRRDEVVFGDYTPNAGLTKALSMSPVEVINEVKNARLRGRGGAGFPTGIKWEFTRAAEGERKFVICNSDEGEPGTFKDRFLLTERCDRVLEGMTITGYAIGAAEGIFYLRGEYAYLYNLLAATLEERRTKGLLGTDIKGSGFSFDIRIQIGAGAYICGEETALISSLEGTAGLPKTRPPFPAQKGYLGLPTVVNNVETLCVVPSVMDRGAAWFARIGTKESAGTKLLSVAGDCSRPGNYEYPFGVSISQILEDAGAEDTLAVQVGGASGRMVGAKDFERTIAFEDLATGGSIMIFDKSRDILDIVHNFMEFFVDENCGYCTPCRAGNRLMLALLDRIIAGNGTEADLETLKDLGEKVKVGSRCGLGQTSPNPVLSTLESFRPVYEKLLVKATDGLNPSFDVGEALRESVEITGRQSSVL